MYEQGPSDADLATFGLFRNDIPEVVCEVWPENWKAFILFNRMSTQWRMGMGGAVGLDYTAIRDVAEFIGIKKKHLAQIFPSFQVMEAEALLVMSESQ
jgi:Phage related hypothetical protein (DUF1799)